MHSSPDATTTDSDVTFHASTSRSDASELARQAALFTDDRLFAEIMHHVPTGLLILNGHRQIVFANRAAATLGAPENIQGPLGLRPGEFVGCVHSCSDSGCGTTRFCRYCGAVKAILKSQEGQPGMEECHILVTTPDGNQAMDLRAWTAPLVIQGQPFTVFALLDIGNEKRKSSLERIFLHDLWSTASAMKGFLSLLAMSGEDEASRARHLHHLDLLADQILDEIQSQRILLAAENGELEVFPTLLSTMDTLRNVLDIHSRPDLADGRNLSFDGQSVEAHFENDPFILRQLLGNMVKNAIEASVPGETVTLGCDQTGDEIRFWVHNPTYMPENIRLQVYNRSFSTKGVGRGLGTYTMKLLTDRYLGGRIEFTSTEQTGTRFTATYPRDFQKIATRMS